MRTDASPPPPPLIVNVLPDGIIGVMFEPAARVTLSNNPLRLFNT